MVLSYAVPERVDALDGGIEIAGSESVEEFLQPCGVCGRHGVEASTPRVGQGNQVYATIDGIFSATHVPLAEQTVDHAGEVPVRHHQPARYLRHRLGFAGMIKLREKIELRQRATELLLQAPPQLAIDEIVERQQAQPQPHGLFGPAAAR